MLNIFNSISNNRIKGAWFKVNINNNKSTKKSNAPTTIYSTNNKNKNPIKKSCTNAPTKIYTPSNKNLNNH